MKDKVATVVRHEAEGNFLEKKRRRAETRRVPANTTAFQSTRDVWLRFQFVSVTGLPVISRIEGGRT
jgi:hypothetical protein